MAAYRRVDNLRVDCLYTGISSGVRAERSVTSMGNLYLLNLPYRIKVHWMAI